MAFAIVGETIDFLDKDTSLEAKLSSLTTAAALQFMSYQIVKFEANVNVKLLKVIHRYWLTKLTIHLYHFVV